MLHACPHAAKKQRNEQAAITGKTPPGARQIDFGDTAPHRGFP
jgi:hypothetical protein